MAIDGLTVSPDAKRLLVCHDGQSEVSVLDLKDVQKATDPCDRLNTGCQQHKGEAIQPRRQTPGRGTPELTQIGRWRCGSFPTHG